MAIVTTWQADITGISDTAGLTWTVRKNISNNTNGGPLYFNYYTAKANATLNADSITVTRAAAGLMSLIVFGISGANTTTPFDTNAGLPNSATGGAAPTVTFSTSNANDILISMAGDFGGANAMSAEVGWTLIQDINNAAFINLAAEYKIVSATQTNATSSLDLQNAKDATAVVDAIVQAAAVVVSTVRGVVPPVVPAAVPVVVPPV